MNASTSLSAAADEFRHHAAAAVPGRLADLLARRVAALHGEAPAVGAMPDDLTEPERAAIDLCEQFVVDVHGLTDDRFDVLRTHFADDEIVAIMFHLACLDGFGKLSTVSATPPGGSSA